MQIPEVGGGLVAMDPHTGRVLAVAGGFSFAMSQFDRAIQAKRQPGSSFKPFVYAAALDNGYKPTSIILDAPIEIEQGPGQDIWKPENYDKEKSFGPTTLRVGIEKSRNQMTVRLAQDVGMPMITEYAKRFGIYDDLLPVLSMSLGAGETTLLRMATAYCMLANGGKQVRADADRPHPGPLGPHRLAARRSASAPGARPRHGTSQPEPEIPDDRKQIIDPHTRLSDDVDPGRRRPARHRDGAEIARTGRSPARPARPTKRSDAWFVGYTPDLVVGVFIGFDTPTPMGKGRTGGGVAAPIFGDFMKRALADKPAAPFRVPPGLKLVRVNLKTGLRAGPSDSASHPGSVQAQRGA